MGPDLTQIMENRFALEKAGGRDIFEKTETFWDMYETFSSQGIYPYFQTLERNDGPTAIFEGQTVIMLGSNNYLGLTTHPQVRQAAMDAVRDYGTSFTGSRLFNGSTRLHRELEAKLAEFLGTEDCLVFTTGYQANLGVLTGLVNEQAVAVFDKQDHASIWDGGRLAKGEVLKFKHNDIADLDRVLAGVPQDKGILVVIDGVYSMEGDIAPLPEIHATCQKHGARLVIDDAHALGVIGKGGRGTASHFEMKDVGLIVGTFSKSLASIGGYIAGTRKVLKYVQHHARPMLFSASLAPPNIAAASKALDILQEEPWRVDQLQANGEFMRRELRTLGFDIGPSQSPIIPIKVGLEPLTIMFWKCLMEEGVYTNPALYPAVPRDEGLLRTSYMATHEQEHLDKALKTIRDVGRMLGVIS